MSTLTFERTALPEVHPPAVAAREVIRCRRCQLVQFRTTNDLCRKCDFPLPPPPPLDMNPAREGDTTTGRGRSAQREALHSRMKTARELTIGRKLRELRDQRELTQEDMAAKAGVPRTYISRIENARLLPGPVMLRRIAAALQVEILDLLPHGSIGNGSPSPVEDAYWAAVSASFGQLQQEQMEAVLEHVRAMVSQPVAQGFTAEPMLAAH